MLRALLAAAVVLACVSACTGTDDEADPDDSQLTAAELGWVRGYSVWAIAVGDEELGPQAGSRLVAVCRERLDSIGPPPTDRLEPALERAREVCPLLEQKGALRRALDVLDSADEAILPLLREEQDLELASGPTSDSRADVELSAFAGETVERAVEVRCWDGEDWERVVEEDNAWTDDHSDPDSLLGWADESTDRINLQLAACNRIEALAESDLRTWTRGRQIEVAEAVGTLVHEVQHFVLPDAAEDEIECAVLRTLRAAAVELGANASPSVTLAHLYRTEIYPEQPEEYITDDCG